MEPKQPTELELAIARTVVWFAVFDYPLTGFEVWKWLNCHVEKTSLSEIEKLLAESQWLQKQVVEQDGFFVPRAYLVEKFKILRQKNFLDAVRKFKKLRRAAFYFFLFPFVRAVFACNTLSWYHTTPDSDIDLFVVVKPKTIWLSRLLLVTPFAILKKRPRSHLEPLPPRGKGWGEGEIDPFCFSFFTTEDNLNFKKLLLPNSDPYMNYWLASLIPIFDRDEIQEKIKKENSWLSDFLPNVFSHSEHDELSLFLKSSQDFSPGKILGQLELLAKRLQIRFFPAVINNIANLDSRVIISDEMLKFHVNDRRAYFYDEWQKKLAKIL